MNTFNLTNLQIMFYNYRNIPVNQSPVKFIYHSRKDAECLVKKMLIAKTLCSRERQQLSEIFSFYFSFQQNIGPSETGSTTYHNL